jgi:hypothetical protein
LTTTHSAQEFMNTAQKHRDTADDIRKHQETVDNIVAGLFSANKGDLMQQLNNIHTTWQDQVVKMRGRITDMADYMDTCSHHLSDKDQTNTDWLPPPPAI